jgi:hypothetical protein
MVLFSRDPVNLIPGFGLLSESSFLLLLPFLPPSGLTFSIFSVHTCDCRPERGREREIERDRERERAGITKEWKIKHCVQYSVYPATSVAFSFSLSLVSGIFLNRFCLPFGLKWTRKKKKK